MKWHTAHTYQRYCQMRTFYYILNPFWTLKHLWMHFHTTGCEICLIALNYLKVLVRRSDKCICYPLLSEHSVRRYPTLPVCAVLREKWSDRSSTWPEQSGWHFTDIFRCIMLIENYCHGISYHWYLKCLFNSLATKGPPKLHITGPLWRNHQWPLDSPHKGLVILCNVMSCPILPVSSSPAWAVNPRHRNQVLVGLYA